MPGSPEAAKALNYEIEMGLSQMSDECDSFMGACDDGCQVEPDGVCPHGYESAALTAGMI